MKTIFVEAVEIPDGPAVEEAFLGDAGFVVLHTVCPACGHAGDVALEVTTINDGDYRAATTVVMGVKRIQPELEADS